MIRNSIIFILALISISPVWAKSSSAPDTISIRRAFADLPVNTLDLLKKSTRLDMLDYYDVDSIYNAPNSMEGFSRLDTVAPRFLKLELTSVSTLVIKILKDKHNKDIVMTLYTIGGETQAPDTDIRFFDASLRELDRDKYFRLPKLSDFFDIPKGSLTSMKEIDTMVPFPTMEYFAEPYNDVLTAKLTVGAFMNSDDYNVIKLFLRPYLKYEWNGSRFRLLRR